MTDQQHTPELRGMAYYESGTSHKNMAVLLTDYQDGLGAVSGDMGIVGYAVNNAIANRLNLCVNHCIGVPDEMLTDPAINIRKQYIIPRDKEITRLTSLNAELVEVVKGILWYEGDEPGGPLDDAAVLERASVVYAKAKEADDGKS